jgi:hypothetical protein
MTAGAANRVLFLQVLGFINQPAQHFVNPNQGVI